MKSPWLLPALLIAFASLAVQVAGCRRSQEVEPAEVPASHAPKVSFVGHQKCAECHAEIAELHHASGHSRTFSLAKNSPAAKLLCGTTQAGKEPFGNYEYVCDEEGLTAALPARFGGRLFPIDLAMGSGEHAVTFVSLTKDRAGKTIGIEHRMTWYASDGKFDITPAQEDLLPVVDGAYFGNVLEDHDLRRCVDCHTTSATIAGTQLQDLYGGVHCESCHGSATAHVAAAERGDDREAKKLMDRQWTARDEIALCGKCHRTADDITPERLARYPKSVVRFQPVGLMKSRCYTESDGALRCTTCHDPHGPPATRTLAQQVATCVKCHQQPDQTKCPVSPSDDCIRCHMPAIDLVRGIEFHDHWIRVRKDHNDAPESDKSDSGPHSVVR